MSTRIDMVKELNNANGKPEKIELGETQPVKAPPRPGKSQPESIEDQMSTAMPTTLQTPGAADAPPLALEEDETKNKKSRGLLSRFKRSS